MLIYKQGVSCEDLEGDENVSLAIETFVKTTEFYEVERMNERTNMRERSLKWALLCQNLSAKTGKLSTVWDKGSH